MMTTATLTKHQRGHASRPHVAPARVEVGTALFGGRWADPDAEEAAPRARTTACFLLDVRLHEGV